MVNGTFLLYPPGPALPRHLGFFCSLCVVPPPKFTLVVLAIASHSFVRTSWPNPSSNNIGLWSIIYQELALFPHGLQCVDDRLTSWVFTATHHTPFPEQLGPCQSLIHRLVIPDCFSVTNIQHSPHHEASRSLTFHRNNPDTPAFIDPAIYALLTYLLPTTQSLRTPIELAGRTIFDTPTWPLRLLYSPVSCKTA